MLLMVVLEHLEGLVINHYMSIVLSTQLMKSAVRKSDQRKLSYVRNELPTYVGRRGSGWKDTSNAYLFHSNLLLDSVCLSSVCPAIDSLKI